MPTTMKTETILLDSLDEIRFFSAAKPGRDLFSFYPPQVWEIVDISFPYITLSPTPDSRPGPTVKVPDHVRNALAQAALSKIGVVAIK